MGDGSCSRKRDPSPTCANLPPHPGTTAAQNRRAVFTLLQTSRNGSSAFAADGRRQRAQAGRDRGAETDQRASSPEYRGRRWLAGWRDLIKKMRHGLPKQHGGEQCDGDAGQTDAETVTQNHRDNLSPSGAERSSDAELAPPRCDGDVQDGLESPTRARIPESSANAEEFQMRSDAGTRGADSATIASSGATRVMMIRESDSASSRRIAPTSRTGGPEVRTRTCEPSKNIG